MSNRNFTEELQQSMQKLLELERAFYQDGFTEEKEHMKRKIQYMKETILELETILNETIQQGAQPVVAQSSVPTVNESPQSIKKEVKKEESLVAMTIPTEAIQEEVLQIPVARPAKEPRPPKVPRTPSPVELFLKNNLKLLIFASFLVIGIVWLFVYVTSLSELSKELRVLAGFGVSVALISTAHVKKFTGNRAIALILVGYVVGLLVLLFGTIVLGVIPQLLTILMRLLENL